jgi:hypothetical protein
MFVRTVYKVKEWILLTEILLSDLYFGNIPVMK